MSQYPPQPPLQQQPYQQPYGQPGFYQPPAPARPTSVTVIGILNIIFAVLGICGTISSLMVLSGDFLPGPNPVRDIMDKYPVYGTYMQASIATGLIGVLLLLISGIGLMKMQEWARKLAIFYAIFAIVLGVIGFYMNFAYLLPELAREKGAGQAGAMGGAVGGIVGGILGMVYPILVIYFMTRPRVRDAIAALRGQHGVQAPGSH